MKIKILLFGFTLFFSSCAELGSSYKYDMYLSHIQITNCLYEDKSLIYFECDIFGDSIVEIPYLEACTVPINRLWESTNYTHEKTINKIHDKIIRKYNFKIYRYKDGMKNYFSFRKNRIAYPHQSCTIVNKDYLNDIEYVFYAIHTEEEFWE